ncbi:hypothetical protein EMIT019CA3_90052 [Bacillus pseudomycoides]
MHLTIQLSKTSSFILDDKRIIHFKHVGPMTSENMVEYMESPSVGFSSSPPIFLISL